MLTEAISAAVEDQLHPPQLEPRVPSHALTVRAFTQLLVLIYRIIFFKRLRDSFTHLQECHKQETGG